jgi:hypothetical protein
MNTFKSNNQILIALRYRYKNTVYYYDFADYSFLFRKINLLLRHVSTVDQYFSDIILIKIVQLFFFTEFEFEGFVLDTHEIIFNEICQ